MSYDPGLRKDPYQPPYAQTFEQGPAYGAARKNSGLGIASFVLALFAGAGTFVIVVLAGVMASDPAGMDEESPAAIALGLCMFGVVGLHLLGILLGVAGLFQADRARTFAVLGLLLNLLVIFCLGGLMVVGLTMADSM